jgi:hypothetical protein
VSWLPKAKYISRNELPVFFKVDMAAKRRKKE